MSRGTSSFPDPLHLHHPISTRLLVICFMGTGYTGRVFVFSPGLRGGCRASHLISSICLLLPVPSSGLSRTVTLVSPLAGSFLTPSGSRFNSYLSSAAVPEAQGLPSLPCKGWGACVVGRHMERTAVSPPCLHPRKLLGHGRLAPVN